jgi:hypothetical protein
MQYLVTSRKAVVLDGTLRYPGDLIEDPSNGAQLIRRGLAVPFGRTEEQAETFSPSPEPAQLTLEGVETEGEALPDEEPSSDGEDSSVVTEAEGDDEEPAPAAVVEEESVPSADSSPAPKKKKV